MERDSIYNFSGQKVVLVGFGNPGRLDDGLGPALVAKLEADPVAGLAMESDYQLVVEHSLEISKYDVVIFADASINAASPFSFEEILDASSPSAGFNSHSVSPEAVLHMAKTMFGANTKGFVLGIRGYEFNGFGEQLSEDAAKNLEAAFHFIKGLFIPKLSAGSSPPLQ